MSEEAPLISVIVAVFNGAKTLQGCIDSVAGQTYPRKELIVIDGASTDGTVDVIKANDTRIAYWESERDRGIFHAWNKALDHAGGEWVCFLGADDYFWSDDVLERLAPHLRAAAAQGVRVVYGRVAHVSASGESFEMEGQPWEKVKRRYRQDAAIPHPGTMHHRSLFETHGRFDESFRMAADYELLLRELKSNRARFVPEVVVTGMRLGGMSNTPSSALLQIQDVARARHKHDVKGFSPSLFWRRSRSLLRTRVTGLIGAKASNLLIDLYRVCTGKRRKWTR
jgi:glycosyltransferase involved in cell wall biosynthesis